MFMKNNYVGMIQTELLMVSFKIELSLNSPVLI